MVAAMVQFDVFENPSDATRGGYPYLVVLQNDQLDHYSTRLVMPLVRLAKKPAHVPRRLAEAVRVGGKDFYPSAHLCAAIPARLLRRRITSLKDQADTLRDALDAVMSGV